MRRIVSIAIILALLASSAVLFLERVNSAVAETHDPYVVSTFVDNDGRQISEIIVPGKPPEIKAEAVDVPLTNTQIGINILSDVPAFDWSYGCSATSAAMLFGYYDRTGYANMYTGPTNGGVCPLDSSIWGYTTYPSVTCQEVPLSATHQGVDGRTSRGSVDDYWIDYGNSGPDPYISNSWTEHTQGNCTGDFMGTNQSKYGLPDGATAFFYYSNGDPLYDYTGCEPSWRDGCHGLRLFAVSRGYSVVTNFFQLIQGYSGTDSGKGFTFANYMSEIDAGRPVLIQVSGHTMLGYGYNTDGNIVYLHDTWDYASHQMTWGGSYDGLQQIGVTVIQLASVSTPTVATNDATNVGTNSATLNMSYDFKDYNSGQVQFAYEPDGGSWAYTSWIAKSASGSYSGVIPSLSANATYHFKARLKYNSTEIEGSVKDFTTASTAIHHYSVSSIGLSQTAGTTFSVTIQAQDQYNNNINTGSETVNISFGKTDTGATPTSTITNNGTATVSKMTMTKAQSGQTITFTGATSRKSGISNSFTVNPTPIPATPTLKSPTSGSTVSNQTPRLGWNASTGATSYGLQVSTSSRFTSSVVNQTGITNTYYDVPSGKLGWNTTYYWRVNASNAGGTSGWSSYWQFKTPSKPQPPTAPTLISPTSGSTVSSLTPALQWNASTGVTSYGVQVSTSYLFTSLIINQTGITALSFSVPTGALKASTTYYWRVNASNANGTSGWSSYRQFKTSSTAVSRGRQIFGQENQRLAIGDGNQGLLDIDAILEPSTTAPY